MRFQGPRNRFLARPPWRDYVVAYILLSLGFMTVDIGVPQRDSTERLLVLILACTLGGLGLVVFFCAVGWSLWSSWSSWRPRRAS